MNESDTELRRRYFEQICPPLYRDTDTARLPRDQFKRVMGWPGSMPVGKRGLYLVGPAGTCKTRIMWQLIERIVVNTWTNVRVFDSFKWHTEVSAAYGDPNYTEHWLSRVCDTSILFIDDIFKGKMTDAQTHAAHAMLERRAAQLKPTFLTSNVGSRDLAARIDEAQRDRQSDSAQVQSESILRRIKEFCEVIRFGKQEAQ